MEFGWTRGSPLGHVNLFTKCLLYLAMERPSSPLHAPGPLERSGPLTAGSGRCPRRPYDLIARVAPSGWDELSRQVGDAARRFPAIARYRRCGRHGLAEGPAGPGSTAPSPDEGGGGVAPAQPRPAAAPASRHRYRRALLGHCRPSSSPWPATAGPAPPPAARCRAPDTVDRRSCRMAARGSDRPGSANHRSAECTDGGHRASASSCKCGPCRTPSRARWRSPPVGGSSGRSRGVTALGLVARPRPTHRAGGHGQAGAASRFHRTLPAVRPAGHDLVRLATRRRDGRRRPRPRPARISGRRRAAPRCAC